MIAVEQVLPSVPLRVSVLLDFPLLNLMAVASHTATQVKENRTRDIYIFFRILGSQAFHITVIAQQNCEPTSFVQSSGVGVPKSLRPQPPIPSTA